MSQQERDMGYYVEIDTGNSWRRWSLLCKIIISPEGVLHMFRLHLCQRPLYKILVQHINNAWNAREIILISVYFTYNDYGYF